MGKAQDIIKQLEAEGYEYLKVIPGRGICGIMRLLFTTGLFMAWMSMGFLAVGAIKLKLMHVQLWRNGMGPVILRAIGLSIKGMAEKEVIK